MNLTGVIVDSHISSCFAVTPAISPATNTERRGRPQHELLYDGGGVAIPILIYKLNKY